MKGTNKKKLKEKKNSFNFSFNNRYKQHLKAA